MRQLVAVSIPALGYENSQLADECEVSLLEVFFNALDNHKDPSNYSYWDSQSNIAADYIDLPNAKELEQKLETLYINIWHLSDEWLAFRPLYRDALCNMNWDFVDIATAIPEYDPNDEAVVYLTRELYE